MAEIQVKFTSAIQPLAVALEDVRLRVPLSLTRSGLSSIVNHLLSSSKHYDFIINQSLLSTSLQEYVEKEHLSTENVLTLEVLESVRVSRCDTEESDSYVLAVDRTKSGAVVFGGYGHITVAGKKFDVDGSVKSIHCNGDILVYGGSNGVCTAKISNYPPKEDEEEVELRDLWRSDVKNVESVRICGEHVAVGCYDASISLYALQPKQETGEERSKRRKLIKQDPLFIMTGHSDAVSCLSSVGNDYLISGSMDKSVRVWSLSQRACLARVGSDHAVCSIDACISSEGSSLACIIAGHADGVIRVWNDPLSSKKQNDLQLEVNKKAVKAHKSWVTGVSFCMEGKSSKFVSVGYDGVMKLWDLDAISTALFTIKPKQKNNLGRLFCVKWSDERIICGCEDGRVLSYNANSKVTENKEEEKEIVGK
jgi:ribosome biogenesis protein YTM1